jgi:hypothetical protein
VGSMPKDSRVEPGFFFVAADGVGLRTTGEGASSSLSSAAAILRGLAVRRVVNDMVVVVVW